MEADVATPETTQDTDKLYQVWSALKKKNPNLPEYSQFKTDMESDEGKFRTVHAVLKSKNPNLPEFDQFTADMFGSDPFKKKVSTEPSKNGGTVGASAIPSTKSIDPAKQFAANTPSPSIMADGSTPQPIENMPGATPAQQDSNNPYKVSITENPVRPSAPILSSDIERMKKHETDKAVADAVWNSTDINTPATPATPATVGNDQLVSPDKVKDEFSPQAQKVKQVADTYLHGVLAQTNPEKAKEIQGKMERGSQTEKDNANLFFDAVNNKNAADKRTLSKIDADYKAEIDQVFQLANTLANMPPPQNAQEQLQKKMMVDQYNQLVSQPFMQERSKAMANMNDNASTVNDWVKAYPHEALKQIEKKKEQQDLDEEAKRTGKFSRGLYDVTTNITQGIAEIGIKTLQGATRLLAGTAGVVSDETGPAHDLKNIFNDAADNIGDSAEDLHGWLGGTPSNAQRDLRDTFKPMSDYKVYTDDAGNVVDVRDKLGYSVNDKLKQGVSDAYNALPTKPQSVSETNSELIVPKLTRMVTDIGMFAVGAEVAKAMELGNGITAARFIQGYEDNYQNAVKSFKEAGIKNDDAATYYATALSLAQGKLFNYGLHNVLGQGEMQVLKGDYMKYVLDGVTPANAWKKAATGLLTNALSGGGTFVAFNEVNRAANALTNATIGTNMNTDFSFNKDLESGVLGFAASLLMGLPGAGSTIRRDALFTAASKFDATKAVLDSKLNEGSINQEKYDVAIENLTKLKDVISSLPEDTPTDKKAEITQIALQKIQLQEKADKAISAQQKANYNIQIKALDDKLNSYFPPVDESGEPLPVAKEKVPAGKSKPATPKDETVTETKPVVGEALPEEGREKNIGQQVSWQGIDGELQKGEHGYYVMSHDGTLHHIESGESDLSNADIGLFKGSDAPPKADVVEPAPIEPLTPEQKENTIPVTPKDLPKASYDFDNNKVTIGNKSYTYDGVESDADGNTTAIRVIDDKGNTKFLRNGDVVAEVEIQKILHEEKLNNTTEHEITNAAGELGIKPQDEIATENITSPEQVQQAAAIENTEAPKQEEVSGTTTAQTAKPEAVTEGTTSNASQNEKGNTEQAQGRQKGSLLTPEQSEAKPITSEAGKAVAEPAVSDAEHRQNIHDKFRKEFKAKGVSDEHITGALALLDARAKSWASEEKGRTPEQYYQKIADVKSGEFETNDKSPIDNIVNQVKNDLPKVENKTPDIEEIVNDAKLLGEMNKQAEAVSTKGATVYLNKDEISEGHPDLIKGTKATVLKPTNPLQQGHVVIEYKDSKGEEHSVAVNSYSLSPNTLSKAEAVKQQFNINYDEKRNQNGDKPQGHIEPPGKGGDNGKAQQENGGGEKNQEQLNQKEVNDAVSISSTVALHGSPQETVGEKGSEHKGVGESDQLQNTTENSTPGSAQVQQGKEKTSLELAKEKLAAIKAKRKAGEQNLGIIFDSEKEANELYDLHKAYVDVVKEWLKEKKGSINDFLRDTGEKLTIALKTAWDEVNGGKRIESPEDLPYSNPDEPIVGVTRAHIDPELIERGLAPDERLFVSSSDKGAWDAVKQKMVDNPDLATDRMNEITSETLQGHRPKVTDEDPLIGLHERVRLKVERNKIYEDLFKAQEAGNNLMEIKLNLDLEANSTANETNNLFISTVGSTGGKLFRNLQALSTLQFDYTSIKNRIQAEQGKALTPEQEAQYKKIADEHAALQKQLADNEAKFAEKEKEHQAAIEKMQSELDQAKVDSIGERLNKDKPQPKNKLTDAERKRKKELDDELKSEYGSVLNERTPTLIEEIIKKPKFRERAKLAFKESGGDFKKFSKDITGIGKKLGEHLPDIFKDAGGTDAQINAAKKSDIQLDNEFLSLAEQIGVEADGQLHEGLWGMLNDMLINRIDAGETDYNKILNDIHSELEHHIPGLERNDLRDLLGGYGRFKPLSKDPTTLLAKEMRTQMVLDSKLQRTKSGELPLRNGLERAKATKETRAKTKEIAKDIKEQNLQPPPTEEEQAATYRSELDAYHASLEHAIEDYQTEIDTGVKRTKADPESKEKKFTDERSKELRADKERLKNIRDAVFKERAKTELEKNIAKAKKLTEDIGKAKKEGRVKDIEQLQKEKDLTDGEIGNLVNAILGERSAGQKKIDNLRKQIDDVLAGNGTEPKDPAQLTDAEKAQIKDLREQLNQAKIDKGLKEPPKTAEEKQLESLQSKLDDLLAGKTPETKDKKVDSSAVKKLKDEIFQAQVNLGLKAAKQMPGDAAINATEKEIKKLETQIDNLQNGKTEDGQPITFVTKDGQKVFKYGKEQTPPIDGERLQRLNELKAQKEMLQGEVSNLMPDHIKDKAVIARDIKNRNRRLTNLESKIRAGKTDPTVFDTKKREPYHPLDPLNPETKALRLEKEKIDLAIKKLENQVAYEKAKIELARRGKVEKFIDGLTRYQRFMIFLNPWGMGRLAYAAIFRPVMKVPTEIAKLALSNIPTIGRDNGAFQFQRSAISRIMQSSPGMFRPTIGSAARATGKYYSTLIAKKTFKDAASEYNRRSNYSLLHDGVEMDRYTNVLEQILSAPEQTHGFMKSFPKIAQHESTYQAALENLQKMTDPRTGEKYDITDPSVRQIAMEDATREAYADVFMNSAEMSKLTSQWLQGAASSKNLALQILGLYGKQLQPVLKVPVNFYHEVIAELPIVGMLDAAQIVARSGETNATGDKAGGIKNLTPDQAHAAARAMVNHAVGLMMVSAGMALYAAYKEDAIKKITEYKYWLHNTGLPLLMMGLHIQKDIEHDDNAGAALGKEALHTVVHETTGLPQFRAAVQVTTLGWAAAKAAAGKTTWEKASKNAQQMLATLLIPAGAAELAKRMDDMKERDPKTFQEVMEMRIPGLRDLVPEKYVRKKKEDDY